MRQLFVLCWLAAVHVGHAQVQRWWRTFDDGGAANGAGSVVLHADTTYSIVSLTFFTDPGRLRLMHIAKVGDTLWTHLVTDSLGIFQGGGSHSVELRSDGRIWFTGGVIPFDGSEPDGRLVCYDASGDTCWMRDYGTEAYEALNGMCLTVDGGALLVGVRQTTQSDVLAVRVDANGDTLWTRTYGSGTTPENAFCVRGTPDNGFIIGGFKVLPGNSYDMYVLKLDAEGELEWQRNYGSPWIDNAAFVEALSDGRYVMAGGRRASASGAKRPVLYLLESDGDTIWSKRYDDGPDRSVFFTVPVVLGDGDFAIAGDQNFGSQTRGMLMRTDGAGNLLWRRIYQTNTSFDHYIYDLRRTLDGGFIMAGTAFDSLLVSQDAWLVKTDSFGCLVPGCQVFDGLEEQVTDLGAVLHVSPSPASEQVMVEVDLPPNYIARGPLRLAMVSAQGALVREQSLSQGFDQLTLPLSGLSPGIYFLHLLDGQRWLAGTKLVKH